LKPELAILIRLQGIDLELRKINEEKSSVPKHLEDLEEHLFSKDAELNELNEHIIEIQKRKVDVEDEFELENVRLGKSQKKLSSLKTNREYQALQKEISEIKKTNTDREDEILTIMEETGSLQEEIKEKKKQVKQYRKKIRAEKKRIKELEARLDDKIADLTEERQTVSKDISPDLLSKYNFLKDRRACVAVAAVTDGVCSACNMNIPPQLYNELLRDEKILTCPSCQRLIYALEVS
jgi:predicted  nucleic acid-binding Zn-ribbon protein